MKQRELKFKGYKKGLVWDSENYESIGLFFSDMERIKAKIMRYTGLKDKNGKGKEIYHKDLIVNKSRNGGKPHLIEWSDKFGAWVGVYRGLEYLIAQELHEMEVVGNFYKNKGLKNA